MYFSTVVHLLNTRRDNNEVIFNIGVTKINKSSVKLMKSNLERYSHVKLALTEQYCIQIMKVLGCPMVFLSVNI